VHTRTLAIRNRVALAVRALDTVSPLATLNRGYAIVSDAAGGAVISHIKDARSGQAIRARLTDGSILAEIKGLEPREKE
jgi:exodeoxyribonuclease VII large subunit